MMSRPDSSGWACLSPELLRLIYTQLAQCEWRGAVVAPRDRLAGEAVCRAWAAALRPLPFDFLQLPGSSLEWLRARQPAVRSLAVRPSAELAPGAVAEAVQAIAAGGKQGLLHLEWQAVQCAGREQPPADRCSMRISVALPADCHQPLQHLCSLTLQLLGDEEPPGWLPKLAALQRLVLEFCGNSGWAPEAGADCSALPLLCLEMPPALAEAAVAAPQRAVALDLGRCARCLRVLRLRAGPSAELASRAGPPMLEVLTASCARDRRRQRAQRGRLHLGGQPYPALRLLRVRNVEGPLDLDLLPALGTLGLVSSPGATLVATRPLRALTALYLGGLAPQLSLDATPALPHMCALEEVVVEGFDAGACFAPLRVTLDPDFCPALRSLDILQVASFSLAATQDLLGLTRLFCDAAGEVGVDLALLPALRELSLPRSAAGVSLAALGPEVTSLQCSLAACGGLCPASWAALRQLQLRLAMHDGALPGSLVPEGDSFSSQQHHGTGQMILPQGLAAATSLTRLELSAELEQGWELQLTPRDLDLLRTLSRRGSLKELRTAGAGIAVLLPLCKEACGLLLPDILLPAAGV